MRATLLIPALGIVAACETAIPDSGVGFNTPEYQANREAALAGQTVNGDALIPSAVVSAESPEGPVPGAPLGDPGTVAATQVSASSAGAQNSDDIARETALALGQSSANANPSAGTAAAQSDAASVLQNNPDLSDEQDFAAVSSRQTIESDAERISRNRANREEVQPVPVPERSGDSGPNIVAYALSTTHTKGTQVYSRAGFNLEAKAQRNCASYSSPDQAQIAFLSTGGPQRDRKGLDPDGDGYACGWDPAPFRRAVSN